MYWPIGTPRIYATTSSRSPTFHFSLSHDGLNALKSPSLGPRSPSLAPPSPFPPPHNPPSTATTRGDADQPLPTPVTPITPITPRVAPVEHDDADSRDSQDTHGQASSAPGIPAKEPILALRVARAGHLFAVITEKSITLWQTKPTVILALVVRSESSVELYGSNVDLHLRPDCAILVVRTSQGYLITYTLATDRDSRVYRPHFTSYHNVQRRRQSLIGGLTGLPPDDILWGPGEGAGISDVSVRFRMVIKVDAGIECALALDDELVVATRKPAAVQCIRWAPDSSGSQTRTEMISRTGWVEKKAAIKEITFDRPMNLATWITNDGRAYAVQRFHPQQNAAGGGETDAKRLFKGFCFHIPEADGEHAVKAVINARFSLIAVGCADGTVRVYSVRDYAGNIPHSHTHEPPVTTVTSGAFTTLSYSPDGYCLFAGFEKGWCSWSMFGKLGSSSFTADHNLTHKNDEEWLDGVRSASWAAGGSEVLIIGMKHEAVWSLEMAKSAVTGCYNEANIFRTVLQTPASVMVYRGYDLPDLTSISAEPFLWHTSKIPPTYLLKQWPIRQTVVSPDGRYVAVAGRRGLAHYSVNSGRWKTFADEAAQNEFQVRGGMCWYQHILVAAVECNKSYEIRLYSRESNLDPAQVLFTQQLPAPVVLVATSGQDSLLVYTYENQLYHYIFTPYQDTVRLIPVGQIAFHGIVRSPARVRGLSWILPESQLVDGDPSQDVAVASVIFLVDGKLVLLRPSMNDEGHLKYDMRVIAQNVEYHVSTREQPLINTSRATDDGSTPGPPPALKDSLWVFDGSDLKCWPSLDEVLEAASGDAAGDLPTPVSIPVDFYPLSILLEKGVILGVESDLVQRRDVNFSFFHFSIRTHLLLPDILRFYLQRNQKSEAATLSQQYDKLEYFAHGLEILLHRVLDQEADTSPRPEDAVLPRVLSLLSSFKEYLDVVLQCTRKTEVRQWKTLFAYLPPAQELFEESLQRGSLKTAGGYLIVLYTLEELESTTEQGVRLLSRAMAEGDWDLCKELARFLAAMDETGSVLRETMKMANASIGLESRFDRLQIPAGRMANGGARDTDGGAGDEGTDSEGRSRGSDAASVASGSSSVR